MGSFLDQVVKDGDYASDALSPATLYNSTKNEVEWKNTFRKFQNSHVPTVLPKIITKRLVNSHYNLTSLTAHRDPIEKVEDPNMTCGKPCNTCRSKEDLVIERQQEKMY